VRNASNDLTFDSVESPVDISTPRKSGYKKKEATSTVSIEIHDFRPLFHTDAKKMNG
jgi:hypothetical protein